MRNRSLLAVLGLVGMGAIAACGGSESTTSTTGTTTTGTGGSSTTTTTTTTTTTAGTGGATGTGGSSTTTGTGGAGGSGPVLTNGCDAATAEDHTADPAVEIAFGGALGFKYAPKCIVIKAGTPISFSGDFLSHPLSGGLDGVKDPASPIKETTTGAKVNFVMANAGTFGFFCEFHQASGMEGAVFVKQ